MKLHFDISKNILKRRDSEILTSYSKNIECVFHSECLSDIYKYALFIDVNNAQHIVDLGIGKCVSCVIPEQALKGNYFSVSVFGSDRYTTNQEIILIQPSGINEKTLDAMELGKSEVDGDSTLQDYEINRINNCNCRWAYGFYNREHPYI